MTKEEILNFAKEHKVKLSVTWWDEEIWLNKIIVPKSERGNGLGGKIIRMLKKYVDEREIPLKLLAASCYGTELNKLKNIYRSLGFEDYDEKNGKDIDYMAYNLKRD
jgi:predicted GNAT family N-acyltransferase